LSSFVDSATSLVQVYQVLDIWWPAWTEYIDTQCTVEQWLQAICNHV